MFQYKCKYTKPASVTLTHFIAKKMAAQTTSHYELHDEEKDIMIYGMRIEEIFSEGIEINTETINTIHQTIPDVMAKCLNSYIHIFQKSNSFLQSRSDGNLANEVLFLSL